MKKKLLTAVLTAAFAVPFSIFAWTPFGATTASAQEQSCPPGRNFQGPCIQVVVFAQHPGTGECCQFANPCSVPPGFEPIFFTEEECEAATE